MKAIEVGDLITFRTRYAWQQQLANAINTTSTQSYSPDYISTAVVMAVIEDRPIVFMWDGKELKERVVDIATITKVISPYNKLIEGL